LGLALDVSKEDDEIVNENGLSFFIERNILPYVDDVHLDYEKSFWGEGVTIRSGKGGC